jgi:heterodisulfide reductase subunit A-like polyferredoxin
VVDVNRVVEAARLLPDVVYAAHQMFPAGQPKKRSRKPSRKINRVVVAACSPTHESIFRGVLCAGLNLPVRDVSSQHGLLSAQTYNALQLKGYRHVRMAVEKAACPLMQRIYP